ncbi:MAG: hypothetical protein HYS66_18720, partial [Deltaproteobacteria bacterium]|nr:hypothetical protein [Deltaproteobacteria bacterium]
AQSSRWDEAIAVFEKALGFVAYDSPEVVYKNFGREYYNLGHGSGSIMLSEEEKRELREMAASESLRREFRTMRSNSQAIDRRISVDELAHWLTVMARACPGAPKPRRFVHYTNVKI